MANLARRLEEYVGEKRKHFFKLKNGQDRFGWLMMEYDATGEKVDYAADYVSFVWAPGPFEDASQREAAPEQIKMEEIDLDSLCYWDDDKRTWRKFELDFSGE